eukprot:scaffold12.g8289.t1
MLLQRLLRPDVPAPVTPYGDDPSAATASAAADVRGAEQEAERAAEGALGEAASQASGFVGETARAVRKAVGAAADAARGVVGAAAEAAKPEEADTDDYRNFEGRPTYADSPGTSGHAADRFRLIKEADDSMQGGVPEPAAAKSAARAAGSVASRTARMLSAVPHAASEVEEAACRHTDCAQEQAGAVPAPQAEEDFSEEGAEALAPGRLRVVHEGGGPAPPPSPEEDFAGGWERA